MGGDVKNRTHRESNSRESLLFSTAPTICGGLCATEPGDRNQSEGIRRIGADHLSSAAVWEWEEGG